MCVCMCMYISTLHALGQGSSFGEGDTEKPVCDPSGQLYTEDHITYSGILYSRAKVTQARPEQVVG